MYSLVVANEKGEQLQLTQNPNYSITSITGLNPPNSNINTAVNANFDGSVYKSSRMNNRNIVITLMVEEPVEINRIALYNFFKSKKSCTVFYKNKSRDVSILGYVESMPINYFDKKEKVQISVICPKPYFEDIDTQNIEFSSEYALFQFPFVIQDTIEFSELILNEQVIVTNSGDVATGVIIQFYARGHVENPKIYNITTGDKMLINITLEAGDIITIDTTKGSKRITLNSDGVITNILNNLDKTSTWLTLDTGDNYLMYSADEYPQFLFCSVIYSELYEGV